MRLGFLAINKAANELVRAANGATAFTPELAEQIINGNAKATRYSAAVPQNDPIWKWIDSVPTSDTSQGVSLRKSFYSLAFPVHPHVAKHLRFLTNFFNN